MNRAPEKMRCCKICGVTDLEARFYDGVPSRCAECHMKRVRENRLSNVDYYRAYDAIRFQKNANRREKHLAYNKTPSGKAAMSNARKKWLAHNQNKRAAHIAIANALRDGKIRKPKNCTICGNGGRLHGHHDDYTKPFDVVWCCAECHGHIHAKHKFAKAA